MTDGWPGPEHEPEQQLRAAFAAPGDSIDPSIVERARRVADRRRRRRDIGVAVGSGAAALALVGGLVVVPQVLGGDRSTGGSITAAASDSASQDSTPTPTPTGSLQLPTPSVTPSVTPSAIIPDWPTARPGAAAQIPDSVLPSMAELGSGLTVEGNRFTDSVGSAPIMGAQYCDAIDVSNMPGGNVVLRPTRGALMSAYKAPNGEISADVTVNLFATGTGAAAMDQLLADRGFCRWFQVTPNPAQPADGAGPGESYWTFTGSGRQGQLAGGVVRRGDVIVGVMTARATQAEALAEAKRLLTMTADRVSAQMPDAKG